MKQDALKISSKKIAKIKDTTKGSVGLVVDYYFELRGWANLPKEEYKKRDIIYGRFTRPAKQLLILCDGDLEKAKYLLDCLKRWAESKRLDWSIETVFKRWGEIEKDMAVLPAARQADTTSPMSLKDIFKKMKDN